MATLNKTEEEKKKSDEKVILKAHLMNLLKRKTVLRMTRAVRDSSFWDLDSVKPSSMCPSWCIIAWKQKQEAVTAKWDIR